MVQDISMGMQFYGYQDSLTHIMEILFSFGFGTNKMSLDQQVYDFKIKFYIYLYWKSKLALYGCCALLHRKYARGL